MFIGPNQMSVRMNQNRIHRSTSEAFLAKEARSSASATKPKASTSNDTARLEPCSPGGAQSVHSRGIANEPRSAWRRLSVSIPETWRTFKTTNRCPRNG